jgi:hypothetical protein
MDLRCVSTWAERRALGGRLRAGHGEEAREGGAEDVWEEVWEEVVYDVREEFRDKF